MFHIRTMRNSLLFIALGLFSIHLGAQNLVPNPSFEVKKNCPVDFNKKELQSVADWWQAGKGTPDHFNACSFAAGVPENVFGNEKADEGESYAGLINYSNNLRNCREYLSARLTRPLKAGEMVCVEVSISSADKCNYVCDGFGVYLSKDKPVQDEMNCLLVNPAVSNPRLFILDQTSGWIRMGDVYVAQGGEEYITLGNFRADHDIKILHRMGKDRGMGAWSYVYVDNVSVTPVTKRSECACENDELKLLAVDPPLQLSQYDEVHLDNILFEFDKAELTSEGVKKLNEVYRLLKSNEAMALQVLGHTDNKGSEDYNMALSHRRADVVMSYLERKGIDEKRLEEAFFGDTRPVADNSTEEGRQKNRRVEFRVIQRHFELVN